VMLTKEINTKLKIVLTKKIFRFKIMTSNKNMVSF